MKNKTSSERLRVLAEKTIRKKAEIAAWDTDGMTLEEIEQTLYELRVHQVELELQNEELRRVQAELEASKKRYFDFYNLAPVGYCTISTTGMWQEVSLTFARLLGVVNRELIKRPFSRFVFGADKNRYYLLINKLLETDEIQECELRLVKPDKTIFWVKLIANRVAGADGAAEIRLVVNDVSERIAIERELVASNLYNKALIEAIPYLMFVLDKDGHFLDYSAGDDESLAMPKELFMGKNVFEVLPESLANQIKTTIDAVLSGELVKPFEYSLPVPSGACFFECKISALGEKKVIAMISNITDRKLAEEHLIYLSFHDVLTGLYNRRYFEEELRRMDTARQLPISIISGDVNGLKLTNDVFGHARGDELIRTAAQYFQTCCRAEDVVVRFGGDEFMAFLPKCDEATALEIIGRIQAQCRDKTIEGVPVSLALGVATKNEPTEEINTIVNLAETRMYKNKSSEVNRIRLDTLEALERTVYEKDYKVDHALRLQEFAKEFGKYLRLPTEMISDLALLATLHDIGKIGIAEEILNKPGALNPEEWGLIKTHPEVGNRILRATRMVSFGVEEGVLMHHEHWDGSGYPKGLAAEAIPFISRAVAIIDAYDVMTHDRPYHLAITHEQAVAELQRRAGTQFDPELVTKFVEFVGAGGE